MQNREFEKNIQQKMEELKFAPSDAVWNKVEAGLPKKEKSRLGVFFILFFAVILFGSLVWWNTSETAKREITETATEEHNLIGQPANTVSKEENNRQLIIDTVLLKNTETITDSAINNINKQKTTAAAFRIKIKSGATEDLENKNTADNLVANNKKIKKSRAVLNTTIKAPGQNVDDTEKKTDEQVENEAPSKTKIINGIDTAAIITENKSDEKSVGNPDSFWVKKKDTVNVLIVNNEKKKKIDQVSKWQYGIYIASGNSNVTSKLFSSALVFDRVNSAFASGAPGGGGTQSSPVPNNPTGSLAFNIGFFANKKITEKWKFSTGINYVYQSNLIKVGSKVDSVVNLNFDANKSVSASNYYRSGNTASYKNKFHLVEIPLLFQFDFLGNPALYLEAGTTVSYLINSNALVYNSSASSYITDDAIFNRLLLSAQGGLGINILQKSKLPLSIGYQFKYGIASVVKKSFGKQHFVNSLLYLKVPLKK